MLNKKDPLIDAIKQVMQNNQADRDAVKAVNEKFGIQDRRVLPHERQGEWDTAYQTVLTEGVEALDEDWDPEKLKKAKKIEKGAKSIKGKGHIKDFGKLIADRTKNDAVTGGNSADDAIKAMNQLYGRNRGDSKAIGKISEEEKLSSAQKHHMDVNDNGKIDSHDLKLKRMGMEEEKKMKGDDPCWDTHKMVGMKKGKGGKPVPNCVPVKEQMADPYAEGQASSISTVKSNIPVPKTRPTSITPEQQNALTNKIKSIKEAKKASMCEDNNEGFNNRRDLSVTASAGKQVVADQLNEKVGNPLLLKKANAAMKPKVRIGDTGVRRPISGTNNVQTRLANLRRSAQPLDPDRNVALDQPQTQSNMALAQNPNINGAGGGNYAAARRPSIVSTGNPRVAGGAGPSVSARDPKSSNALDTQMRRTAGERQGPTAAPKKLTAYDLILARRDRKDVPGAGPGQGSGAPKLDKPVIAKTKTRSTNINKVLPVADKSAPVADKPGISQTTTNPVEPKNFGQAFSAARKAAAQKSSSSTGKFTYKGKDYQTNIKGEKYVSQTKQTDVTPKPTTTTSVTGGQGIAGIASTSTSKPVAKPNLPASSMNGGGVNVPKVDSKSQGFAPAGIDSRPATGIGPQQAPKPPAPTPNAISNLSRVSQKPITGGR